MVTNDSEQNLQPERALSPRSFLPSMSHSELIPEETQFQLSKKYLPLDQFKMTTVISELEYNLNKVQTEKIEELKE